MGDAVDACTQVGGFYLSCQSAYLGEGDPVMKRYLRRIAEGHGAGQKGYAHGGKAIAEGSIAHAEIPFQCQPDKPCGAESEYGRLNDPTSCLARAHEAVAAGTVAPELLQLDSQITDANGALFDVVNDFAGCIAGCHEILRRQGLLQGTWCLNPDEAMSPGQAEELDRVAADYPHLSDDGFVAENLERWLA